MASLWVKERLAVQERYWELLRRGWRSVDACREVGVHAGTGRRWRAQAGGAPRFEPVGKGRYLSLEERLEIADMVVAGESVTAMAARLGRPKSTISRELARNRGPGGRYGPYRAQRLAEVRARRPKPTKLGSCPQLRAMVEDKLVRRWSPEQISGWLAHSFPSRPELQVSHETIYQALFVQGRGELRKELHRCLRTGRALRRPRGRRAPGQGAKLSGMVMISERPAEAADRAVPGHWEGDLIVGPFGRSAIATLVERASRFVMLARLPGDHSAETVRDALVAAMAGLPEQLRRSLAWDQGTEMALHRQIAMATGMPVYFCDPHSPWQRGSNENTNGLLRQYFPKGTDLSVHSAADLDAVAAELNARPRKTLGWATPAQALQGLLDRAA